MKILTLILVLLIASLSLIAQKNSSGGDAKSSKETIQRLKANLPKLMSKADVPGLSVALICGGKLVWFDGFGTKNSDTGEPVAKTTIFEVASLSKPVFAYATLKLVDQGKIDLDTPLNKYLGNNYDVGDDARLTLITVRRVLSHSSGFPNWRRPRKSKTLPINFTPGEKFSYSGEGFVYLSKVIEKITKTKFEIYIEKEVFAPLGMTNSSFVWKADYGRSKTFNHNALGNPTKRRENRPANAAASLHTTAEDYSKFMIAALKRNRFKNKNT